MKFVCVCYKMEDNEKNRKARLIAYYLPQFHTIPENDKWWGKGFTEWTNVKKAKPLFSGHYQPQLPADLGFYDLRIPGIREKQARMAKEHGIEGFCYWHYWFMGKKLLERPLEEVLKSKKPKFPFCIGWANENWTGVWHGAPNNVLQKQEYSEEDHINHFNYLLPFFLDDRYLKIDGKPIFLVYRPNQISHPKKFTSLFKKLAKENGLRGIHIIANESEAWPAKKYGFDASTSQNLPANASDIKERPDLNLPLIKDFVDVLHSLHGCTKNSSDNHYPNIFLFYDLS